ncbi:hypothetical protein TNCV_711671 [Trichonephila clavipes]|nr:hypothetical protein TNCV_711671 [Trichonephila clavipes]
MDKSAAIVIVVANATMIGKGRRNSSWQRSNSATAYERQGLLGQSQYTCTLDTEVHEQMSRSGGEFEVKPHCLVHKQAWYSCDRGRGVGDLLDVLPQNRSGTEGKRTVECVLQVEVRPQTQSIPPYREEFRGRQSDIIVYRMT